MQSTSLNYEIKEMTQFKSKNRIRFTTQNIFLSQRHCNDGWNYPQKIFLLIFCTSNLLLEAFQLYNEVRMCEFLRFFQVTNLILLSNV